MPRRVLALVALAALAGSSLAASDGYATCANSCECNCSGSTGLDLPPTLKPPTPVFPAAPTKLLGSVSPNATALQQFPGGLNPFGREPSTLDSAHFGVENTPCWVDVTRVISSWWNSHLRQFPARQDTLKISKDPCLGTSKYLKIEYRGGPSGLESTNPDSCQAWEGHKVNCNW